MLVTFHNVTVTIDAPDATTAYTMLCEGLGSIGKIDRPVYSCVEWDTDTYTVDNSHPHPDEYLDTSDLWPK